MGANAERKSFTWKATGRHGKIFKLGVTMKRLPFQKALPISSVTMNWREGELKAWEPARRLWYQGEEEGQNRGFLRNLQAMVAGRPWACGTREGPGCCQVSRFWEWTSVSSPCLEKQDVRAKV